MRPSGQNRSPGALEPRNRADYARRLVEGLCDTALGRGDSLVGRPQSGSVRNCSWSSLLPQQISTDGLLPIRYSIGTQLVGNSPLSKKHKKRPQSEGAPDHSENRTNQDDNQAAGIDAVRTQPSPEVQQRTANEQEYLRQQVQQAQRLNNISTWATVIAFLALFGVAYNAYLIHEQVGEMQNQVGEMQRSNASNFEAFEDTERPWLSVEITPASNLFFVNGKQAALTIKVSIKNVGKSIAKDIQVDAKLFPTPPGLPVSTHSAQNQGMLCNNPQSAPLGWFDLFPTDTPAERNLSISVLPSAIAARSVTYPGAKPRGFVGFYVVGCVTYRFSFGTEIHQTRFAYHLIGPAITSPSGKPLILPNGMPTAFGSFEVGVNVPEKKLQLMRELFARNDAN